MSSNKSEKQLDTQKHPKTDSHSWGEVTDLDDRREAAVKKIINLFKEFGAANYVGNQVNLMEHSLQAAQLAYDYFRKGDMTVDDELVLGSLLHDFGKVVLMQMTEEEEKSPEGNKQANNQEGPINHEALGAEFLAKMGFSERI